MFAKNVHSHGESALANSAVLIYIRLALFSNGFDAPETGRDTAEIGRGRQLPNFANLKLTS